MKKLKLNNLVPMTKGEMKKIGGGVEGCVILTCSFFEIPDLYCEVQVDNCNGNLFEICESFCGGAFDSVSCGAPC